MAFSQADSDSNSNAGSVTMDVNYSPSQNRTWYSVNTSVSIIQPNWNWILNRSRGCSKKTRDPSQFQEVFTRNEIQPDIFNSKLLIIDIYHPQTKFGAR